VFQIGADPVVDGLVASMNRPGGNVTDVSRLILASPQCHPMYSGDLADNIRRLGTGVGEQAWGSR
jgi:hypothetical protein